MKTYHTVISPKNNSIIIDLPKEFEKEERIEVIVLPYRSQEEIGEFQPSEFRGILKKESIESVDLQLKELREEWNRDI